MKGGVAPGIDCCLSNAQLGGDHGGSWASRSPPPSHGLWRSTNDGTSPGVEQGWPDRSPGRITVRLGGCRGRCGMPALPRPGWGRHCDHLGPCALVTLSILPWSLSFALFPAFVLFRGPSVRLERLPTFFSYVSFQARSTCHLLPEAFSDCSGLPLSSCGYTSNQAVIVPCCHYVSVRDCCDNAV